jgi:hypothetical protein
MIFHTVLFLKTEHQRLAAQMENCKFCLDSPEFAKHLIIAIGLKVFDYLRFLFINLSNVSENMTLKDRMKMGLPIMIRFKV